MHGITSASSPSKVSPKLIHGRPPYRRIGNGFLHTESSRAMRFESLKKGGEIQILLQTSSPSIGAFGLISMGEVTPYRIVLLAP
jgi:hypothetical protein